MQVRSVTVCPDTIDVTVTVGDGDPLRTSADSAIPKRAIEALPGLLTHRCENDKHAAFAEELGDTEVPHLFEHVVLELMARSGSPRSLRGETSWDFRTHGRGVFRVSLEYDDDLVCLGAIKLAEQVMEFVLRAEDLPELPSEVERLAALRSQGR